MRADLAAILARPIAHRGLHERARGVIENSLLAAEAAVAHGFGIECDIQRTGDGAAIVFHDETLERLTEATGRVEARSALELGAISLRDSRDHIPTLQAFLARLDGRVPLVIEIKSRFDGDLRLAERALSDIGAYGGPVALKSFDPDIVAFCRARGAPCPLGLVGQGKPGAFEPDVYDFLSWRVDDLGRFGSAETHPPLMSWTVRSQADAVMARRLGAQIVFEGFLP